MRAWVAAIASVVLVAGISVAVIAWSPERTVSGQAVSSPDRRPPASAQSPVEVIADTVVVAKDGKTELTIPAGWYQLPDGGPITSEQMMVAASDGYAAVLVIGENKSDHANFAAFARWSIGRQSGANDSRPERIKVGGLPAVRHRFRGTADVGIQWWHVAVAGKRGYYAVVGQAETDEPEALRRELVQVMNSLRERPVG